MSNHQFLLRLKPAGAPRVGGARDAAASGQPAGAPRVGGARTRRPLVE
jgi:hypothetical protein